MNNSTSFHRSGRVVCPIRKQGEKSREKGKVTIKCRYTDNASGIKWEQEAGT